MELTMIKLGGSLITNKSIPYKARPRVILRLANEIKRALEKDPNLHIILGNGSGSFAHTSASKYGTADGYNTEEGKYGYCYVQNDAIRINRICVEAFIKVGLNCIGVSPNNIILTNNKQVQSIYLDGIRALVSDGIIPILYGDTLTDIKKGCCIYSCDQVISAISQRLPEPYKVVKVISVGDFSGVLDSQNKIVKFIDKSIYQELLETGAVKGSDKTDVTGGMKAKLNEMMKLSEAGIESIILSGKKSNNLFKCLIGGKYQGTLIKI